MILLLQLDTQKVLSTSVLIIISIKTTPYTDIYSAERVVYLSI